MQLRICRRIVDAKQWGVDTFFVPKNEPIASLKGFAGLNVGAISAPAQDWFMELGVVDALLTMVAIM